MAFLAPVGALLFGAASSIGAAAAIASPFLAAASTGVGIASSIIGLTSKATKPAAPQTPAPPNPGDSLGKAQVDAQSRQRARLANGGQTIYTSPTGATVPMGNVQMHQLLGV